MRTGIGLTQEQLAEKTGLSTRYWQSLEAGEYFPPLATLARVKNPGASPEAFKNMISRHEEKPKQASGYQTQWE